MDIIFKPGCKIILSKNSFTYYLEQIYSNNKLDIQIREFITKSDCCGTFLRYGNIACYVEINKKELIVDMKDIKNNENKTA